MKVRIYKCILNLNNTYMEATWIKSTHIYQCKQKQIKVYNRVYHSIRLIEITANSKKVLKENRQNQKYQLYMNTELPRETPLVTLRPEPWAENLKHN